MSLQEEYFGKIYFCAHCGYMMKGEPYIPVGSELVFCSFKCYDEYLIDGKLSLPKIEVPWADDEELKDLESPDDPDLEEKDEGGF